MPKAKSKARVYAGVTPADLRSRKAPEAVQLITPFTITQLQALANALLVARPPVIPGSRIVSDPTARETWYKAVTEVANVVCRGHDADTDRRYAATFFDACQIPD